LYILVQADNDQTLEEGVKTIERVLRGEPVFFFILGNHG
jgi:hypothetical protein